MSLLPSRKRLFLHIGLNKTGSTYIQRSLVKNSKRLEKRGYFYPANLKAAYFQKVQHVPLAEALTENFVYWLHPRKRRKLDRAIPEFMAAAEAYSGPNIIASSEAFGSRKVSSSDAKRIAEKLRSFDVTIIAYVRRQDDYILSNYQQDIKVGSNKVFDLKARLSLAQNLFSKRLSPWQEAFGFDRVIVRPYAPSVWPSGDLFLDLLKTIGCSIEGLESIPIVNEGLDLFAVNLLRVLNGHLQALGSSTDGQADQAVRGLIINHLVNLNGEGKQREKLMLSNEQIMIVKNYFASENKELLGEKVSEEFITARKKAQSGNTDVTELDQDLAVRLILSLCRENISLKNNIR